MAENVKKTNKYKLNAEIKLATNEFNLRWINTGHALSGLIWWQTIGHYWLSLPSHGALRQLSSNLVAVSQ